MPIVVAAGDDLWASNDTDAAKTVGTDPTKAKEITTANVRGVVRVKFTIAANSPPGSDIKYGKIYKNGSPVGTERSIAADGAATEFSEDIAIDNGSVLQVYVYAAGIGNNIILSNFRLYIDSKMDYTNTLE